MRAFSTNVGKSPNNRASIGDIVTDIEVGRLKSIYLTQTERSGGLDPVSATSLPQYVTIERFQPKQWFHDEILNAYADLCRQQDNEYIASTLVYPRLVSYYKKEKPLVSVE